jgi:uncharacterized membrane protein YfcA
MQVIGNHPLAIQSAKRCPVLALAIARPVGYCNGRPSLDALSIFVFLASTFAAALITGLAGFAFGIIVAGPWLHVLKPAQATTFIVAFGPLVQGYSVWKLRTAIRPQRLLPILIGSALGAPIGVELLRWIAPAHLRAAMGIVLMMYSVYGLLRPRLPELKAAGHAADGAVGFFGGCSAARRVLQGSR